MEDQDPGVLQIHLEDPDMEYDDNLSHPSSDRVLSSAQSRATLYGQLKGVSVKKPVLKTVPG